MHLPRQRLLREARTLRTWKASSAVNVLKSTSCSPFSVGTAWTPALAASGFASSSLCPFSTSLPASAVPASHELPRLAGRAMCEAV